MSNIADFCLLSKDDDFIEITEWSNGDGVDIVLSSLGYFIIPVTFGQYNLIKKLMKKLN